MSSSNTLRKATEIGLMSLALSVLFLAGCGGGGGGASGSSSNGAAVTVSPYVAALADGIGLRRFMVGTAASSGVSAMLPLGITITATSGANGSYALTLAGHAYAAPSWTAYNTPEAYYLNAAGSWVPDTMMTAATLTPNADGTMTRNFAGIGSITGMPVAVDLSGFKITAGTFLRLNNAAVPAASSVVRVGAIPAFDVNGNSSNGTPGVIPATATYPAGSKVWVWVNTAEAQDTYAAYANTFYGANTPAGNLASISFATSNTFTASNPLCYYNGNYRLVYAATQPATANTARFDVYGGNAPGCTAVAGGSIPFGTIDLVFVTVRTQTIALFSNFTSATMLSDPFSYGTPGFPEQSFLATVNGAVYGGEKIPAGAQYDVSNALAGRIYGGDFNKTAMDAIMNAGGLPAF